MTGLVVASDDPRAPDVMALLQRHLAFAHEHTLPELVFALDVSGLLAPEISFFGARRGGALLGVGALRTLDAAHAELKSMHTAAEARGQGVGRAVLDALLAVARGRGVARVSLETGTMDAFAPARALYRSAGFAACGPFGEYRDSHTSAFFTLPLTPA